MKLTQAKLRKLLNYDPLTGVFTWRERPIRNRRYDTMWNVKNAGKQAGTVREGYNRICIGYGKFYRGGRLAFLYMTGRWPKADIDHINRVRDDDRWSNLREATRSQNLANGRHKHKHKGARKLPYGRWQARGSEYGKYVNLGIFDTRKEACTAYQTWRAKHFGDFS